jgi:surface carbohydrate biosynthesis protein (TIGR04326 family)
MDHVYRWNGYAETPSVGSLLRYVERNADRLKSKYLNWIHELGESSVGGRRLIERLVLGNGLSYWWMTLLVEKSPYKSPISDAVRLLALDEILAARKPARVRYVGPPGWLQESVRALCRRMEIKFEWQRRSITGAPKTIRDFYLAMPLAIRALLSGSRYLWRRWPFKHRKTSDPNAGGDLFLCSYFFNFAPDLASKGEFRSRYWGGLQRLMEQRRIRGNWLQLYVAQEGIDGTGGAIALTEAFNRTADATGYHTFLDAYLSVRVVTRVVWTWLWLNFTAWRLRNLKTLFVPLDSNLSLWPLMKGDWNDSMRGPAAISNLFYLFLFEAALRDLPRQRKGVYLCENQAWERALIHTWQMLGHGELVGVAHATVRFWDLRYFSDRQTILSRDQLSMPRPTYVALNGRVAVDAFVDAGYPKNELLECEALRYQHLAGVAAHQDTRQHNPSALRVLVLGDYLETATRRLLQLLEAATAAMPAGTVYAVKPHPSCPVDPTEYRVDPLEVVTSSLDRLMNSFDVAYTGNMTSAAVDVYIGGLPVVVMLDNAELNFSPLRGCNGVRFVSEPAELAEALSASAKEPHSVSSDQFFFLDPAMPRWSRLLAS